MKKFYVIISLLLSFPFLSCNPDELRSSPTYVDIDGSYLTLDAYVWRDYTPPTAPDGDPLRSSITLNLISGPEILSQVQLIRQYVIYGNEVWAADIFDLEIGTSTLQGTSSNGPKWGPDVLVDVVLEFTYNGKNYKLLSPNQNIEYVQ